MMPRHTCCTKCNTTSSMLESAERSTAKRGTSRMRPLCASERQTYGGRFWGRDRTDTAQTPNRCPLAQGGRPRNTGGPPHECHRQTNRQNSESTENGRIIPFPRPRAPSPVSHPPSSTVPPRCDQHCMALHVRLQDFAVTCAVQTVTLHLPSPKRQFSTPYVAGYCTCARVAGGGGGIKAMHVRNARDDVSTSPAWP